MLSPMTPGGRWSASMRPRVDNLQWGGDYPHIESTFPRSRQILEEILVDCTEEEKAKIAGGNAARVYNLN